MQTFDEIYTECEYCVLRLLKKITTAGMYFTSTILKPNMSFKIADRCNMLN